MVPGIFSAHGAVRRVLSIAESTEGIAHLRDLMNAAPVDVAHLLKAVWKELLLRGVWGSSRCGWEGDGVTCRMSVVGNIEAADAAMIFMRLLDAVLLRVIYAVPELVPL